MKYLKLDFRDAKLFLNHKGTKCKQIIFSDDIDDNRSKTTPRKDGGNFKEFITVYQISNVIHKLFGERPVPSFRKVIYDRNEYLFNKAKESYLSMSYHEYDTKTGKKIPYREFILLDKSDYNSRHTNSIITWELVRKRLNYDDEEYTRLKEVISSILGLNVNEDKPYMYFVEKLRLLDIPELTPLDDMSTKSFKNHILNEKSSIEVSFAATFGRTGLTITKGIDSYINLNGSILIPVSDTDIETIRNNFTGTCTILDGGVVTMNPRILHSEDFLEDFLNDYRKVKDISTEKTIT